MKETLLPRERIGILLVGVARRWRSVLDERLSQVGLSDATWAPLIHIQRSGGGITQKELASRVGIDGSSLVRLLDLLAGKALIERRQDAGDRRSNLLFLTEAGRAAVRKVQRVLSAAEQQILADLDDAQAQALVSMLESIDARTLGLRNAREGTP